MRGLLARLPTDESSNVVSSRDEDEALVVAAKADIRAFAPLYSRYFDPIYRYCFRRLGHPEAAEDAAAQVFAKALAGLPGYRTNETSFRSWLFAIAHNVLIDETRRQRPSTTLDAAADTAVDAPSPEDAALAAEAGCMIRELLLQLPPDQRQVMELRLAGLTGPEIAAVVGRTLGSVKIAQVRAMAQMRTALGVTANPGKEAPGDKR